MQDDKEQIDLQAELLELSIKAGRRLMHDFNHLLNEIPGDNPVKSEFEQRAAMWHSVFYPDNGMKNYRAELHQRISWLEVRLSVAHDQMRAAGLVVDQDLPF